MTLTIPTIFPDGENNLLIQGPAGNIEILTLTAKASSKGVAIICHPHPLHEGTMHNKVVHTLSRAFFHKDIHSIRFNFRGVGKSEGQYGDAIGEVDDLMAVIAWAKSVLDLPIYLAGFSFGAYIAAMGAAKTQCKQLFSVAPAVTILSHAEVGKIDCPWVVIAPMKDEVISPDEIYAWFERRKAQQNNFTLHKIPDASHFFHGKLVLLRTLVEEAIVSD